MELSGNKVRKLEFLMADAVEQQADTVITIGGIQSNHCRATTVASNYLNLDTHLILRTSKVSSFLRIISHQNLSFHLTLFLGLQLLADGDPGLVGNLLVERLVGANVHLISKEEYSSIGSEVLPPLLSLFDH